MNMEKPKSIERIERMRNGEKVKCPKCGNGFISAVGEPSKAYLFKCSGCDVGIVMTKNIDVSRYVASVN